MRSLDICICRTLYGDWEVMLLADFFAEVEDFLHRMTFPASTFKTEDEAVSLVREMLQPDESVMIHAL